MKGANLKGIMKNEGYSRNRFEKRALTFKGAHKTDLKLDEELKYEDSGLNLEATFNKNMSFGGNKDQNRSRNRIAIIK
jgi:hypothetical protein